MVFDPIGWTYLNFNTTLISWVIFSRVPQIKQIRDLNSKFTFLRAHIEVKLHSGICFMVKPVKSMLCRNSNETLHGI